MRATNLLVWLSIEGERRELSSYFKLGQVGLLLKKADHSEENQQARCAGAGRLLPGATLRTQSEQNVEVMAMEPQELPVTVYNLEIEKFHTYFVGKDGVWVHNLKLGDPNLPDPWDKDP